MMANGILEKMGAIDRRAIYWLLVIILLIPYATVIPWPIPVSGGTKEFYDKMEALPSGAVVLVSQDTSSAVEPELGGALIALAKYFGTKDYKIIMWSVWEPTAALITESHMTPYLEEAGKKYGEDYVNFGFITGGETAVARLADSIHDVVRKDWYGNDIGTLPLMDTVDGAEDIDVIVTTGSFVHWTYLRQMWLPKYNSVMYCIMAAGAAPETAAYYPGQIQARLIGQRGSAEFEQLLKAPGVASKGMIALSLAHILVVVFIVIGNISYLTVGKAKRGGAK